MGAYLAGVIPLGGIALLEMGLLWSGADQRKKLAIHAALISIFLVVGHVAMVFGMVDPRLGGWAGEAGHSMSALAAGAPMDHGKH